MDLDTYSFFSLFVQFLAETPMFTHFCHGDFMCRIILLYPFLEMWSCYLLVVVITIIMIVLKGVVLDFNNLLTARRTVSNTYA